MAKVRIIINGQEFPCYFTLGAGLAFKELTGHDVSEMKETDLVELGTLMYCQCQSACRREKIDFPYGYQDFMDQVTDEDLLSLIKKSGTSKKK